MGFQLNPVRSFYKYADFSAPALTLLPQLPEVVGAAATDDALLRESLESGWCRLVEHLGQAWLNYGPLNVKKTIRYNFCQILPNVLEVNKFGPNSPFY